MRTNCSLVQQLGKARIKIKEDTPVFAVIQPVVVPSERSKPKRTMILAIWTFLGIIVAIGWVFGDQYISSAKNTGMRLNNFFKKK